MTAIASCRPPYQIVYRKPAELKPNPNNPRTHSAAQLRKLCRSIRKFGVFPLLIDENARIIAGHACWMAAKKIGLASVPTICIAGLTPAEFRALAVADNKIAEEAGWDPALLAIEFQEIEAFDPDFDLSWTGFEFPEIDIIRHRPENEAGNPDKADTLPPTGPDTQTISAPGFLWRLGNHFLLCADATEPASYAHLMGDDRAQICVTDPPYNLPIAGHVSSLGRHREFPMGCGEMSSPEFTSFLEKPFAQMATFSVDGSLHYVFMDSAHLLELLMAGRRIYDEMLNICVWVKSNGGMGSFYRSQHEHAALFKSGRARHINNVQLGRFGRNRTTVWSCAGANSFGSERDVMLAMHPTTKPVQLVADILLDASHRGGIVLDPFAGSGTTLIAAERTHRRARLMELDALYCDLIVRRYQAYTGDGAVLVGSGRSFNDIAAERASAPPPTKRPLITPPLRQIAGPRDSVPPPVPNSRRAKKRATKSARKRRAKRS